MLCAEAICMDHENQASGKRPVRRERPIPDIYYPIDNDLARDNLENDIPYGDLEDIYRWPE